MMGSLDVMEYEGIQDMEVEHERMGCEGVKCAEVEMSERKMKQWWGSKNLRRKV